MTDNKLVVKILKHIRIVYWLTGLALSLLASAVLLVFTVVKVNPSASLETMSKQIFLFLLVFTPVAVGASQIVFKFIVKGVFPILSSPESPLSDRVRSAYIFRLLIITLPTAFSLKGLMFSYISGALSSTPYLWLLAFPYVLFIGFIIKTIPRNANFIEEYENVGV